MVRAGRPGAQGHQPRASASRSWPPSATTSPSSRRCRRTTARGSTSARCAGPSSCEPLFEFSGACAGCGETPYLKLLSQLFGDRLDGRQRDRLLVDLRREPADHAVDDRTPTGAARRGRTPCSRTTPSSGSASGSRPTGRPRSRAAGSPSCATTSAPSWSTPSSRRRSCASRSSPPSASGSRSSCAASSGLDGPAVTDLRSVVDHLVRRSVWIVGGDGWAYDIGSGGLDHVLASGRNVNVLVLDTEVYSNTGGQMSKATPLGAVAKFAAAGKTVRQEGHRPAGDRLRQRVRRAGRDGRRSAADAAGVPRGRGLRRAVAGHRLQPLHRARHRDARRARPAVPRRGQRVLAADPLRPGGRARPAATRSCSTRRGRASRWPTTPTASCATASLANTDPAEAERLHGLAEEAVAQRWEVYEEMATRGAAPVPRRRAQGGLMELATDYLGLTLRNPLVASASPLSQTVDGVRRLADAGVGAVVLLLALRGAAAPRGGAERAAGRRRHRELRRVAVVLPGRRRARSPARAAT